MATDFYYFGEWDEVDGAYQPAGDSVGLLDLRSIPKQAALGETGFGFFASDVVIPGYILLGTSLADDISPTHKQYLKDELGLQASIQATNLVDIIWELATVQADPTGNDRMFPLMPTVDLNWEFHLGGHSLVKSKMVKPGDPEWENSLETMQHGYKETHDYYRGKGSDHHRKVMGSLFNKWRRLGVDDGIIQKFVPLGQRERHLPPGTQFNESFNQGDSTTLGPDLTWTEVENDWETVSNEAFMLVGSQGTARAEHALSSSDHYAEITPGSLRRKGGMARFAASVNTGYVTSSNGTEFRMGKIITGTFTQIAVQNPTAVSSNTNPTKIQPSGSTIKGFVAGTEEISITDTAIPSGVHCGIAHTIAVNASGRINAFECADLVVAGIIVGRKYPRGVMRGTMRGVA